MKYIFSLIFCLFGPVYLAHADVPPAYPTGFDRTGIQFSSSEHQKLDWQRNWYCASIKFIETKRLDSLSVEMKAALAKPLKFGDLVCNDKLQMAGLPGPKDKNEQAYVDFVTIEYALTFLKQATDSLPENDDIAGGLHLLDQGILELRINWVTAQTGFDANSRPSIVDPLKYKWTSMINDWVGASYAFYTR